MSDVSTDPLTASVGSLAAAPGRRASADPSVFVTDQGDGLSELTLLVRGATCGGCLRKIERAFASAPGVSDTRFNLSTGRLVVRWDAGALSPSDVVGVVEGLGFDAAPFAEAERQDDERREARHLLQCLAVAGFAAANIMMLSVAVWSGHGGEMGPATRDFLHLISAVIALPAALYAGQPFFRSAFRALKAGGANMDVPISLAVLLSLALSLFESLNGGKHAYFDAAVMLLFFLLIGRYLDRQLRARTQSAARDLLALQTVTVRRFEPDGSLVSQAAGDVRPGDRLLLTPGDRVAVDSEVVNGSSSVDMSLVTGESRPVEVGPGTVLHAGVVNGSNQLILKARSTLETSLVAELARLIEAGSQARSRYVRLADKAARAYVPLVHGAALATFLVWLGPMGGDLRAAVLAAMAVLIITCPCALGLAAPAVHVVASGRLFRQGILVRSGDGLERLAEADCFVFDKTGTLTLGKPSLVNRGAIAPERLQRAATLARASNHPLAQALAEAAGPGPVEPTVEEHSGYGLSVDLDGKEVRLGQREWARVAPSVPHPAQSGSQIWLTEAGEAPVCFVFEDTLRPDAADTLAALKRKAIPVVMLSGDETSVVASVAAELGLDDWRARMTPQDKVVYLQALKAEGKKVAMVGDGLNDAPSLAHAHVSLSPGTAADAAQAAADFIFLGQNLRAVDVAQTVSTHAHRRVQENFGFAGIYNVVAIPLAFFGYVTPLVAALAMSGSSIVVTLNALRRPRLPGTRPSADITR
ncbi:MAG: heavy metal translocating P-type ATPase [Pseudomonadota bacterium]